MTTRKPTSTAASTGAAVLALPTPPPPELTEEEIAAARQRAQERNLDGWVNWLARPEKKVAIIGFTKSRELAPWGQDGWEIWLCNNLWQFSPDTWHRLYDLHDDKTIDSDSKHAAFMSGLEQQKQDGTKASLDNRPLICWKPREVWPTAVSYPKEAITDAFGRYFTNSISWMIAHAIFEGASEIHVYGVDMAQGTEYAAQRPSCEYFLGYAAGRGIKVYVPPQSDLLKVSAMYGVEDDSALRIKLDERMKELDERFQLLQQQQNQINNQLHQIMGARENTAYFRGVWVNAAAERDGQAKSEAPEPQPQGA